IVLDFMLTLVGVSVVRMGKRLFQVATHRPSAAEERRVVVVGAGSEGEALIRELTHARMEGYRVVALIDDDANKHGTYLHGVKVVGGREAIPRVIAEERVDEVLVAISKAPGRVIREVVGAARGAGVESVRIVP